MTTKLFTFVQATVFLVGQAIATIIIASIGLVLFACPYQVRYRFITLYSHFIIWWAQLIWGISYQVQGNENLPPHNAIVLCKHQSAWETLFLQVLLPAQSWILKKELLAIPFFGWALRLLEPIAIDRKQASSVKQLLAQGKMRLQQGRWVIIFPEGTRMPVGKVGKYSRSGAALAKESGYLIVPIAHNAGVFWPRNAFLKKKGVIQVVIGPSLDPAVLSVEEIQQKAQTWIEETMLTLPQQ